MNQVSGNFFCVYFISYVRVVVSLIPLYRLASNLQQTRAHAAKVSLIKSSRTGGGRERNSKRQIENSHANKGLNSRATYTANRENLHTDRTLIGAEEGPKVLAPPPTAHMAQAFLSLAVAIYTLGGYNWRHRGDF